MLSEYYQGSRILPPNMTAQILVVFMTFFSWFFQNVFRKLVLIFFATSETPNPLVGSCQSNLKDCEPCLQIWLLNFFNSFRDMMFFVIFSKSFQKNHIIFFRKIWNSQPCSWMLSEYSKELQILPSNMTVQILIVFEIRRFLGFFQKIFRKLVLIFFKVWNSQPCSWVLSE